MPSPIENRDVSNISSMTTGALAKRMPLESPRAAHAMIFPMTRTIVKKDIRRRIRGLISWDYYLRKPASTIENMGKSDFLPYSYSFLL